jgi:hypothetical protein
MNEGRGTSNDRGANSEDLSREIAGSVARRPGDLVRCSRVSGSHYRCNWWAVQSTSDYDNPSMRGGQLGTTHRVRKSQFLDVTRTASGLRIEVISTSGGGD